MAKLINLSGFRKKPKRKRPGVHAKTKTSRSKSSQYYKKRYKGQGKCSINLSVELEHNRNILAYLTTIALLFTNNEANREKIYDTNKIKKE